MLTTDEKNALELESYRSADGRGTLCVMDRTGDTKLMWDRTRPDEVDAARATFDKLRKKGYLAFVVKADGDKGVAITEFDPTMEKIILAPAVVGG